MVVAGVAAAVIEMVFVLPIQACLGASPLVVFQSIAAGFLGKATFHDGLASAALGLGVHLLVSLVAAGVYIWAACAWDDGLIRRPVAGGVIFGVLVYVAMTFGVAPLSAIGYRPAKSLVLLWASLVIHMLAFGLPIALVSQGMLGVSQGRVSPAPP